MHSCLRKVMLSSCVSLSFCLLQVSIIIKRLKIGLWIG